MEFQLISQGAEAKIYKGEYLSDLCIIKERIIKKYRHPDLDKRLCKERMKGEVKNITKARKIGINTPYLLFIDYENRKIFMQYIENSLKLKDYLNEIATTKEKSIIIIDLMKQIGEKIAILHNNDIIHGDLTTSNILIKSLDFNNLKTSLDFTLYFIDFGLSFQRNTIEDKAVDLYVLEKAFLSTHPQRENDFKIILEMYEKESLKGKAIISKLNEVRNRGRKKLAFG